MNELVKFDQVKADMAAFQKENNNLVFNYEDPQGNKDARSHIFKLRKIKTVIADIHKETKAEAWGVCRMLDKEKKDLTIQVDGWIDVHYKPIKEIEEREAKAAAGKANAERLEAIRVEAERVAETERRENELAEREAAAKAKEDELAREKEKLEAAKQAEIDKAFAVNQAQRQAERDRVAAIAKTEQDKKDAVEAADREKKAAVEAEQEKALRAEAVRQEKIAQDEAEKDRIADIEAERVADVEHREGIEGDIRECIYHWLSGCDFDDFKDPATVSQNLLDYIKDGEIPHVTINY